MCKCCRNVSLMKVETPDENVIERLKQWVEVDSEGYIDVMIAL